MTIPQSLLAMTVSELEQSGVKGMQWGVTRSDDELASANGMMDSKNLKDAMSGIPKFDSKKSQPISVNENGEVIVTGGGSEVEELSEEYEEYLEDLYESLEKEGRDKEFIDESIDIARALMIVNLKEAVAKQSKNGDVGNTKVTLDIQAMTASARQQAGTISGKPKSSPKAKAKKAADDSVKIEKGKRTAAQKDVREVGGADKVTAHTSMSDILNFKEKMQLKQYGVKGQKWGVRRSDRELARARSEATSDAKKMTDTELKDRISRIKLEQEYVKLVTPQSTAKGKSVVKEIVGKAVKENAQSYTTKYVGKGIETAIAKSVAYKAASSAARRG